MIFSFDEKKWFIEASFPGVRRCKTDAFKIQREIFKGKSGFQNIHIFESPGFGRMLALDGIIQLSQSDEFIYHEMIVHPAVLSHPHPGRFLVVGGGDGGVLREASKHPLREIFMVEIDSQVVGLAKKYLPFISNGAFNDKRLKLTFEDGKDFIKRHKDFFDIIVVDSTDPVGPGEALFKGDFYKSVYEALRKDGMAVFQLGPFLDFDLIIKSTAKKLRPFFRYLNLLRLPMPSYSCGCEYCFLLASKSHDPSRVGLPELNKRLSRQLGKSARALKYYSPRIHQACMVMPPSWQI